MEDLDNQLEDQLDRLEGSLIQHVIQNDLVDNDELNDKSILGDENE